MSEAELREEITAIWALTARLADKVEQLHIRLNPDGGKSDFQLAQLKPPPPAKDD